MINLIEFPAITAPKVWIGCKVIDIFAITRGFPDGWFITNVSVHQLNAIQRQMIDTSSRSFQHTN